MVFEGYGKVWNPLKHKVDIEFTNCRYETNDPEKIERLEKLGYVGYGEKPVDRVAEIVAENIEASGEPKKRGRKPKAVEE